MLRFSDLLMYWSVQILHLQVLGKEEEENPLVNRGSCDAPGTGDGLNSVVREEACGASPLFLLQSGWVITGRDNICQNLPKPQDHRFLTLFRVNLL